jgi:adenine phosphoribosyltransferase
MEIDKVIGIEARGFIVGAPLAYALGKGFVPIRKKGKLPAETIGHDYELEYGTDRIEIHTDAIAPGERVLLVDDLIATGGTAEAATRLIEKIGGKIVECCFVIDLPDIGGRKRLEKHGYSVFALCEFEGD